VQDARREADATRCVLQLLQLLRTCKLIGANISFRFVSFKFACVYLWVRCLFNFNSFCFW
jgi:hypothetical protein